MWNIAGSTCMQGLSPLHYWVRYKYVNQCQWGISRNTCQLLQWLLYICVELVQRCFYRPDALSVSNEPTASVTVPIVVTVVSVVMLWTSDTLVLTCWTSVCLLCRHRHTVSVCMLYRRTHGVSVCLLYRHAECSETRWTFRHDVRLVILSRVLRCTAGMSAVSVAHFVSIASFGSSFISSIRAKKLAVKCISEMNYSLSSWTCSLHSVDQAIQCSWLYCLYGYIN